MIWKANLKPSPYTNKVCPLEIPLHSSETMKIFSYIRYSWEWRPVEVEVQLRPGIPTLQVVGLADQTIRESSQRIQSALYAHGFEMPRSYQVVVNLKPVGLRKSSEGLDLAIAASILWQSGQMQPPSNVDSLWIFGSLNLDGSLELPEDFCGEELREKPKGLCYFAPASLPFDHHSLSSIKDLKTPLLKKARSSQIKLERPKEVSLKYSEREARQMALVALGEHSCLLAGTPGRGKSTWARSLHQILRLPSHELFQQSQVMARFFSQPLSWRPLVAPHHSCSSQALLGGGRPIRPGALSRAHGGILLLDEFLEFAVEVQESLREPLDTGHIEIYRGTESKSLPAKILLIATTNLCGCGQWLPQRVRPRQSWRCRCSRRRLENYHHRLRGPMLDRIPIIFYWGLSDHQKEKRTISLGQIFSTIEKARLFAQDRRGQSEVNQSVKIEKLQQTFSDMALNLLEESSRSPRRYLSSLRVARTLADIEGEDEVSAARVLETQEWTLHPFRDFEDSLVS